MLIITCVNEPLSYIYSLEGWVTHSNVQYELTKFGMWGEESVVHAVI